MKTKPAKDNRKRSPEAQRRLREMIIDMRQDKRTNIEAADASGYSRSHSSTIWQRHKKGEIFNDGKIQFNRGTKLGNNRKISDSQEARLKEILLSPPPIEFDGKAIIESKLWDNNALFTIFNCVLGHKISRRSVFDYLNKWGIRCINLSYKTLKLDYKEYDKWMETEYEYIKKRIREENAEIFWLNYANITKSYNNNIYESKAEHLPAVVNMLYAISNRRKLYFVLLTNKVTADDLYDFLMRLIYDCKRNLFIILKHNKSHKSKKIDLLFSPNSYRYPKIELHYLPHN